jgi:hypothetical protein
VRVSKDGRECIRCGHPSRRLLHKLNRMRSVFPLTLKSGAREIDTAAYSVTAFSEICQSLPSKIEMCSVFIGE